MIDPATAEKVERLNALLREHAPVVIAYSGGVDSAYLLAAGREALGDQMLGVIADSASLPRQALAEALALAEQIGATVEVVATEELQDERYASNPMNRCYFCKAELFTKLDALARERGYGAIAYGENADDMRQTRPGRLAAEQFAVLAPLRDAGLTEGGDSGAFAGNGAADSGRAGAAMPLVADPARDAEVTIEALGMIERGEALVRSLGFKVFRVRHVAMEHETRARVQIAPDEMGGIAPVTERLVTGLREVGYDGVEIDPAGYRAPQG